MASPRGARPTSIRQVWTDLCMRQHDDTVRLYRARSRAAPLRTSGAARTSRTRSSHPANSYTIFPGSWACPKSWPAPAAALRALPGACPSALPPAARCGASSRTRGRLSWRRIERLDQEASVGTSVEVGGAPRTWASMGRSYHGTRARRPCSSCGRWRARLTCETRLLRRW
jgi:hypothetical protein